MRTYAGAYAKPSNWLTKSNSSASKPGGCKRKRRRGRKCNITMLQLIMIRYAAGNMWKCIKQKRERG